MEFEARRPVKQAVNIPIALGLVLSAAVLLGGCRRTSDTVAQFAENTRTATERLAVDSERANQQREEKIDPSMSEVRNPPPVQLVKRYETREGPDGLFIYDTEKHSVARIGAQAQSGLTQEQADKAVGALVTADAKGAAE